MQTTTFDLDTAITEAVTAYETTAVAKRAEILREQDAQEQREQQRQAEQIATCAHLLREDLGDALYAALAITVTWAIYQPQAAATIDNEPWTIAYTTAAKPKYWSITRPIGLGGDCTRAGLRSVLLRAIAQERELRAQQAHHQAQQEAERAAQLAEHTRCTVQLAAALESARRDLWQWPDGQPLTLYRWRWYVGGDDFESAWSATDDLDRQGYVPLYHNHQLRTIRLDMLAHQPVIERRIVHSIDELPADLRERVRIEVPGIWFDYTLDQYRQVDDAVMCHEVGMIPCAWVCTLFAAESPR